MHHRHGTRGLLILGALLSPAVLAAPAITETDFLDELPVVLSVSRLSQAVSDAPAAVTIIDQDMIQASGFRDIPDLLRLVPGFTVAYTRNHSWAVAYHGVADAFSRRFQVLVDGRSIYNAAFGAVPWAELPLSVDDIERIEVVRGPNAASHGANAFFAVIDIRTKHAAQTPGTFISLQAGEQRMAGLTLRQGGGTGPLKWRLTLSAQDRDRFETDTISRARPDQLYEFSRTYLLNGRLDYQRSATETVSAQFGLTHGDWDSGRLIDPLEPRHQRPEAQFVQFKLTRNDSPDQERSWQAYFSRNSNAAPNQVVVTPVDIIEAGIASVQTRANLEFSAIDRLRPDTRIAWGAELRRDTTKSLRYFNTADTLSGVLGRVYANLEWQAHPDWLIQAGAMLEHHHYVGTDLSPRVAANFTLAEGHTLRAGFSQATRTPTFFEQEGNLAYYDTRGNLLEQVFIPPANALKSERIRSREIGYVMENQDRSVRLDARVFLDRVERYLDNQFMPTGQYSNAGALRLHGGELQLSWQPLTALHVDASFAHVRIKADARIDDDIPKSSPRNSGSLLARYHFANGWSLSSALYAAEKMKWLSDGDITAGYLRADLRLARRGRWQGVAWEAAVVGQNLGGNDLHEFRDENIFSPRVYGSLTLTW